MNKLTTLMFIVSFIFIGCISFRYGTKKYDLNNTTLDQITEKLNENYLNIKSISGSFDFSYSTETDRKQSSGYLYLTSGDTLYIEIKGLVGETETVMFIDKDSLKAVNYFEKIFIRGKSDDNSIRKITGMNFGVGDLKNSFWCYSKSAKPISIVKKETGRIVIRVQLSEKNYQFVTLNDRLLITEVEEYEERDIKFKKQYDYFTFDNGHTMPKRIRIKTFNPPSKLTVFYSNIKFNKYEKIDYKVLL
ncbi:MAG: DUF4292 domain-containing protein [Candidatus Delongbacteria bacterium]|nr:DUF4292 domain-containing protein [Candidatus Delongbacteria bacterium]